MNVMCRGSGCSSIVRQAQRWCPACWAKVPEETRARVLRCSGYVRQCPKDAELRKLLAIAIRDTDRCLSGQ